MKIRLLTILVLTAALAACSSTPDRNATLEQARNNFDAAQSNPEITTLAANELKQAGDALVLAERAWKTKDKDQDVDHLAYLANQRITIARESATDRAAQAVVNNASSERSELRLDMRTNEAEEARRRAMQAEEGARLAQERAAELERELDAKKTERGMVVTLGDVLFETGKSELQPNATRNISRLAEFMQAHPETTVQIEGHTDSVGSTNFNYGLAQRRADSVKNALMSMGVAANRMTTRSHGPDMPTASNDNAAGRQMNRRVEIIFPNS